MLKENVYLQYQPSKQEVQNGGGILPEEDSCVISEIVSDTKEEEAKVHTYKSFQELYV